MRKRVRGKKIRPFCGVLLVLVRLEAWLILPFSLYLSFGDELYKSANNQQPTTEKTEYKREKENEESKVTHFLCLLVSCSYDNKLEGR
jgi:hypothetical protein